MISDKQAMWKALQAAQKGIGWVEPNPPVGCVILDRNRQLLSSGYHKKYGADHAEVQALKKVKNKSHLKGAYVFVTLEPCHHTGKTPPCSKALAEYPIKSLMYGTKDPFTNSRGLRYLRNKKIEVHLSPYFQEELKNLVKPFTFSCLNKKSFVSLKAGTSLDGVIALNNGQSQWITNECSRKHAHFLRASHSAVLIGVNTLLMDNPQLNIRFSPFDKKTNKVIILDPQGKSFAFLPRSRLLKSHPASNIFVFCADKARLPSVSKCGVQRRFLKTNRKQGFCLSSFLTKLYQEDQIQSVLVEGGGYTLSQFLKQQVAQRLYLYMAPCIMGTGLRWSNNLQIKNFSHRLLIENIKIHNMNSDFLVEGYFKE